MPTYIAPYEVDPSMRALCNGWWCNLSKAENVYSDKMKKILSSYAAGTFPQSQSIHNKISKLINNGYKPALCVSGFFHLLGLGNYTQNLKKSYDELKQGSNAGCWACNEILSFHPLTDHKKHYMKLASKQGSAYAKYFLVKQELMKDKPRYDEIISDVYHLGIVEANYWIKKHRSGIQFATCVQQLAGGKYVKSAWHKMVKLAQHGNVMAALWVLEGVKSNRTNVVTKKRAIEMMVPSFVNGPWMKDYFEIVSAHNKFNKTTALEYFASMGDNVSSALISYPFLLNRKVAESPKK